MSITRAPGPWVPVDLRAVQRRRWAALARECAEDAYHADETQVEKAFRIVLATIEGDAVPAEAEDGPAPAVVGARQRAVDLVASGLTITAAAEATGRSYSAVWRACLTAGIRAKADRRGPARG